MNEKWNKRFMAIAQEVASWSKDPLRQVGAVAVSPYGRQIAEGYNGFPSMIDDDERLEDPNVKLLYVVHAEMNLIYNAASEGVSLRNSTVYVTLYPCHECAKGLISVAEAGRHNSGKWENSHKLAEHMFTEAQIDVRAITEYEHEE